MKEPLSIIDRYDQDFEMEKDFELFTLFKELNNLIDKNIIKDLSEERIQPKKSELKKEKPKPKNVKELNELKPKKEKIKTASLEPASESDSEGPEYGSDNEVNEFDNEDSDNVQSDEESDDEKQQSSIKFSKIALPKEIGGSSAPKKNKYQKLREAAYRDKLAAQNPDSQWENVEKAAAGEKVEPTKDQLLAKFNKDKKERQRKNEKKREKEEKAKKAEERKAKRAEEAKNKPRKTFNDTKKFGNNKKFGGKKFNNSKSNHGPPKGKFSHK